MNLLLIKNKYLLNLVRVLALVSFFALPYAFTAGNLFKLPDLINNPHDRAEFVIYILLLFFFFLNTYLLLPKIYFAKRYILYLIVTLIFFSFFIYITYYFQKHPEFFSPSNNPVTDENSVTPHIQYTENVFMFLLVFFISLFIRTNFHLRITENEKHNVELSYLKSQIKPHFLFNTLNSIYALAVRENATNTADAMLKLSGMMRYVVTESENKFVALEKEITYINNYVELQKLRLDKSIKLSYIVKGRAREEKIAPIILIPFIENAFKYGVNPDENSNINISIEINPGSLQMIVENHKVTYTNETREKSGFGIEITKSRLNLLYPNKHKFKITENEQFYKVQLIIFWK